MIVEEKKFQEEDGTIGYYEGLYDSSNILGTTYFPQKNTLYISFNRGGVYSYSNVTEELYEEFKNAESQGKFFAKEIKSQPNKYVYRKEFTLYPEEVKAMKEVVENSKADDLVFENGGELGDALLTSQVEPNNIIFYLENEEQIKLDEDGFHWQGELVQENEEIYKRFMEWFESINTKQIVTPMDKLEEYEIGLLEMAKNVLGFYANNDNYSLGKPLPSSIELDKGSQAREALKTIIQLQGQHDKMVDDYKQIMDEEMKNASDPDAVKDIINTIKNASK